jgi:hypothetical protein
MKNVLVFNQPVLDITLPNLEYITILTLQKVINLETPFYKKEIDIIAKSEFITFLKEKCCQKYTISELTNLKFLSISNNELTSLPDSIGNLINLTHLSIDNNNLTSLPDSIGNLINLEMLSIYNNNLTNLPKNIKNLTKLILVYADINQRMTICESIVKTCNIWTTSKN